MVLQGPAALTARLLSRDGRPLDLSAHLAALAQGGDMAGANDAPCGRETMFGPSAGQRGSCRG